MCGGDSVTILMVSNGESHPFVTFQSDSLTTYVPAEGFCTVAAISSRTSLRRDHFGLSSSKRSSKWRTWEGLYTYGSGHTHTYHTHTTHTTHTYHTHIPHTHTTHTHHKHTHTTNTHIHHTHTHARTHTQWHHVHIQWHRWQNHTMP